MCPCCPCSLASLNVKLLNILVSVFPLCDDSPLECTTPLPECRAQWPHLRFPSHPLQKPVSPESTPSPDPTGAYSSEGHCSVLELFTEIQSGVITEIGLTGIVQPKMSAFIYSTSCCYKPM